jgi:hypothetical protein
MAKTQKEMFEQIIALAKANDRQDIVDFAEGRITAITRKSAKASSKRDAEREALLAITLEALGDKKMSIADLMSGDAVLGTLTNQKISSLLAKLVDDGKVERVKENKIMHYFNPEKYEPADTEDSDDEVEE